jgi:hypothetical protein
MQRQIVICNTIDPSHAALAINAALFLSNAIRKDVKVIVNVKGFGVVYIDGSAARRVYPDSESLIGMFKALKKGKRLRGVQLLTECPSLQGSIFCPSSTSVPKTHAIIDPFSCEELSQYTLDQRIAILNILLDRLIENMVTIKPSRVNSGRDPRNDNELSLT